ncbi:MAG: hypothetical protein Q6373_013375 [Candidatus Sigynarchaeota archaeon]
MVIITRIEIENVRVHAAGALHVVPGSTVTCMPAGPARDGWHGLLPVLAFVHEEQDSHGGDA